MYLKRIGSVYYFYARVPIDLVPILGKAEVKKSLKTSDLRTAKVAAKVYALDLEKLGMIARTRMLDDVQLRKLLQRYKDSYLLGVDEARNQGADLLEVAEHQAFSKKPIALLNINNSFDLIESLFSNEPDKAILEYEKYIRSAANELKTNLFSLDTRDTGRKFVADTGLDIELPPAGWFNPNDDLWFEPIKGDFLKVLRKMLQTQMSIYATEIQRLKGNFQNSYDVSANDKRPPLLLSEAIDKFCSWRQREKPANERTQQRYREYFNVMIPLLGDRDVTEFTRQDLLKLKEQLHSRVANASKNPKIKRPLDKRTINTNYISKIGGLFRWLHANDYVDKDFTPYLVQSLTAKERRERKRKPYDSDDLKKIFDLLPFDPKQQHFAWVPLIAAYSGARQGEICQLLVCDIQEADGIPYLNITEEDDHGHVVKTIKNENSRRLVPIHPVLVDMGFLKYVDMQKARGKKVLFEHLNLTRTETVPLTGQYYSKLFQAFNRTQITDDPKKVFHSFRHTVHNELKQAKVPPDIYHSITGHVPQLEMDAVYSQDHKLQNKYEALLLLDYPLDLGKLREKYMRMLEAT